MKWQRGLRAFGVVAIVVSFALVRLTPNAKTPAFAVAVAGIVSIVTPEILGAMRGRSDTE